MNCIRLIFVGAATALVAGCAVDHPDNVPLHGEWEIATRLSSMTVDGMAVPPATLPPELKGLNDQETRCGEPMFIDRDWQQDDIDRRLAGKCTIDQYRVTPTRVTGKGMCQGISPGADFNPRFTLDIAQAEDHYRMTITMLGSATISGLPGRHVISVTAKQEGKRIGDC